MEQKWHIIFTTVCPRIIYPFIYSKNYYINRVTTSGTYSKHVLSTTTNKRQVPINVSVRRKGCTLSSSFKINTL